jgi:mRNA interferase MazF
MTYRSYHPERGDVVHLNFDPQRGREMAGEHFAVVLSPKSYNRKAGLCVVVPATTKYHKDFDAWMLAVPEGLTNPRTGRPFTGWVYTDQIKSLDYRERDFQLVCQAPGNFIEEILDHTLNLLDPHQA